MCACAIKMSAMLSCLRAPLFNLRCAAHCGSENIPLTNYMLAGAPHDSMQDIEKAYEAAQSLLNKVSLTPRLSDLAILEAPH